MADLFVRVDLDANDGALRAALFDRGWLPPDEARKLRESVIELTEALGETPLRSSEETERLLDYCLNTIKQQSKTIEMLLESMT